MLYYPLFVREFLRITEDEEYANLLGSRIPHVKKTNEEIRTGTQSAETTAKVREAAFFSGTGTIVAL